MRKNLRVKFVVILLLMMIVSGICSLIISALMFSGNIEKESKNAQRKVVDTILELYDNTDFTLNKIIELSNNDRYEVILINNLHEYAGTADKLHEREFLQIKTKRLPIINTILKVDDKYIKISNSFNEKSVHIRAFFLTITSLIISTLIATIISGIASKRILRPIRTLSKATEEVAKGNFSVKIGIPKDYEFALLAKNFNKMVHELSSIETLRNDFVSNVSHEIKTPIASIQGFAKLIQDKNLNDDERSEFTDIIISELSRLSKLTSNILKLSKLENQEVITGKAEFALDEQIRCAILIMEPEWSEKGIDLDIDLDKVSIIGNEDLLQQVWLNIIGNAIKFTEKGGTIGIKLMDLQDKIVIKVSDNGVGMNEETQRHIFDKFYQGDKSHLSKGNGLGLSLVKRIIELCDGEIKVRSKLYYGTTFTIGLPKK
ncbi:MAG: HAMP domain-containing histidine kinase [Clostridium sulfidigenes]|uniref:Heme sensor protein HssS n=1 Tax=Clostridium sulfidigenes TaxID=318464 RepID=A0A927W2J3_9CLOT|nr:HAMP domain-containing histidine kinase [Clostridium sulfidigenes]